MNIIFTRILNSKPFTSIILIDTLMKCALPIYLLLFCLIAACNSNKNKPAAQLKKASSVDAVTDITKILLSTTYLHPFSDPVKQDIFKLLMTGKSINEGKLLFEVISFKNKIIYSEKCHGYDLLGDLELPTDAQKEDTIRARFNTFFKAGAFQKPALEQPDTSDTDYADLKTQKDISSDATAIGFNYSIGYETVLEIAYSKKKQATVVCYGSD